MTPVDKTIEELAAEQGVLPATKESLEALAGTWPGEPDDGFEDAIDELRHGARRKEPTMSDNEIYDGGPMYPPPAREVNGLIVWSPGASKREVFAKDFVAAMMAGRCAYPHELEIVSRREISNWAIEQADDLLAALQANPAMQDAPVPNAGNYSSGLPGFPADREPLEEDAPEPSDPGKMVRETADAMNRCYAITHGLEQPECKGWPDVLTDRQIEREIEEQEQEQEKEREQ